MKDLLYLNPFVANFVHETDIWGEEYGRFLDVASIHADAFATLRADLLAVAGDPKHTTRVRFLVGMGGSGKSHLFSRLRRHVGEGAIFAFASNPPTRSSALLLWALDKVVLGLRRPRLVAGELKPYSQLEALLYLLLLKQGLGLEEDTLDELHGFWAGVSEATREDFLGRVHGKLVAQGYEAQSLRGMLGVLRPDTREAAFRWLSGSTNLLDEELHALGQQHTIEDDQAQELLKRLGRLSRLAEAPLVLVLDQLDLMTAPEQIDELQRLLFTLINESHHWFVVIGLVEDKFALWSSRLTEALRTRLKGPDGELPFVELQHLTDPAQKEALIRQRLSTPELAAARVAAGATDDAFPLSAADCASLASREPIFPRDLLAKASAVYSLRVRSQGVVVRPPQEPEALEARIHLEFRERRERLDPAQLSLEKASLADRICEAVDLLARALDLGPVRSEVGPLEKDHRYKGTDAVVSIGARSLRIVAHHVHRGSAFPSFLRQVAGLPRDTLLVRDGAAGISGEVTTRLLGEFRGTFLHLPRPALADLAAMGEVLAEMREGNFASMDTTPEPTEDNVRAALSTLPWVTQGPLAQAVMGVLRPEAKRQAPNIARVPDRVARPRGTVPGRPSGSEVRGPTPAETGLPAPAPSPPAGEPSPPAPATSLAAAVEAHLRAARWLMFERLRLWLTRQQVVASAESLRAALESPPLSKTILRYPSTVRVADEVQILVWNGDDA
jgi:hypothetical protein